jgi:hypothetical protein
VIRWADKYEVSQSRSIDKLSWVPVPINRNSNGYLEMMEKENGIALYGSWLAIIQVVAECDLRGSWIKSNYQAHSIRSLSIATRVDKELIEEVINLAIVVGWIEEIEMPTNEVISSFELIRDFRKLKKTERKEYNKIHPMELWYNKFKPNTDSYQPSDSQVRTMERKGEERRKEESKNIESVGSFEIYEELKNDTHAQNEISFNSGYPANSQEVVDHAYQFCGKNKPYPDRCIEFFEQWQASGWTDSNSKLINCKQKLNFFLRDYDQKKPKEDGNKNTTEFLEKHGLLGRVQNAETQQIY